jgi:hypothetical protein
MRGDSGIDAAASLIIEDKSSAERFVGRTATDWIGPS